MTKDHYVAVFGNEEEFGEFDPVVLSRDHEWEKKNLCQQLVRRLGLTTARKYPKKIKVFVFRLEIIKGKLERRGRQAYDIDLPLERMTADEYNADMEEELKDIPEEFRSYVSNESYDRGHSAGYEEVLSIAKEMIYNLKPCIENYRKRIQTPA